MGIVVFVDDGLGIGVADFTVFGVAFTGIGVSMVGVLIASEVD